MNLTKKHKKRHFLVRVPSEKFRYLKNEIIFFEKVDVRFHHTFISITYIKASQIGDHRLSGFGRGLRGLAHILKENIQDYKTVPFEKVDFWTEFLHKSGKKAKDKFYHSQPLNSTF